MILDKILESKRQEVEARKAEVPASELVARAQDQPAAGDFRAAVTKGKEGIKLIAEIKKASPSAGVIREDFWPEELAPACEQAGAAAISVLTDTNYFQGSLDHLTTVKEKVTVPVLRKDFIIDDYQVFESRAAGADAILLIARALEGTDMKRMMVLAAELGMAALVEVHSEREIRTALDVDAEIIGVNNRDLDTLKADLDTTVRLRELIPDNRTFVSESAISSRSDVKLLERLGVDAVLVGQLIMKSRNVGAKVKELLVD